MSTTTLGRLRSRALQSERGSSIVLTIFILLSLTAMCLGAMQLANIDSRITANDFNSRYALYIAEAGIAHAIDKLRWDYEVFSAEGYNNSDLLETGVWKVFVPETEFADGTYSAVIMDDDDADADSFNDSNRTILIRATGTGHDAQRTIEVALEAEEVI